jgi:hypothetical protein
VDLLLEIHNTIYTAVPNRAPTAAVSPIASTPQKATRKADFITGAPPTLAASTPNTARKIREFPNTTGTNLVSGATSTVSKGIAAPTANALAEGQTPPESVEL